MTDFIVIGILVLVIGAAVFYIVRAKKRGVKCIGCPAGANCSSQKGCQGCTCGCQTDTEE